MSLYNKLNCMRLGIHNVDCGHNDQYRYYVHMPVNVKNIGYIGDIPIHNMHSCLVLWKTERCVVVAKKDMERYEKDWHAVKKIQKILERWSKYENGDGISRFSCITEILLSGWPNRQ